MRETEKIDPRVLGYVEYQLEHYKQHKRQLAEYRSSLMPSGTTDYPHSEESRLTEAIGLKLASDEYILEQLRTSEAIERVISRLTKEDRHLLELIYWKKSHTITGAGMTVNMSKTTAYRHVRAILTEVACELGLSSFTPSANVGKRREKKP